MIMLVREGEWCSKASQLFFFFFSFSQIPFSVVEFWLSQIISVRSSYLWSFDRLLNHLSARRPFKSLRDKRRRRSCKCFFSSSLLRLMWLRFKPLSEWPWITQSAWMLEQALCTLYRNTSIGAHGHWKNAFDIFLSTFGRSAFCTQYSHNNCIDL